MIIPFRKGKQLKDLLPHEQQVEVEAFLKAANPTEFMNIVQKITKKGEGNG